MLAHQLTVTTLANFSAETSVFGTETMRVLLDPSTWQTLWAKMTSNNSPGPALPSVDFSKDRVVLAAVGAHG